LDSRGIELELDARPSDALALAVRVGAPIWVAEQVVEQVGMSDFGGGAEA
jgi:bifunctional DNase/RNase